jgi:hypothetical protein
MLSIARAATAIAAILAREGIDYAQSKAVFKAALLRDNLDERRVASFGDVPETIEFCLNELLPLPHQALPLPHGALPLPHQPASAGRLSRRTPSRGLAPGANP